MTTRLNASAVHVATEGSRLVGALIEPPGTDDRSGSRQVLVAPDQDHDVIAALLLHAIE